MSDQIESGEMMVDAADPQVHEEAPQQEQEQEQNVPLSALEQERAHRQELQEQLNMVKEHMALMQAQPQQQTQQRQEPDVDDNDVLTVGEAKRYLSQMDKQYRASIEELKMAQTHPDYGEVVSKYLPEVLKSNPKLKTTLHNTQDYELAYFLAKNSEGYRKDHRKKSKNEEAQRILQNTQQPGSLSGMGGISPVSQAKRYKDMPDDEFRELVNRNLG